MSAATIAIGSISFTADNKMVVSGTVDADIEVSVSDQRGNILGHAQPVNGDWSITAPLGSDFSQLELTATGNQALIDHDSRTIVTGIKDSPYKYAIEDVTSGSTGTESFYDQNGTKLYDGTWEAGASIDNAKDTLTGDSLSAHFVFISGPGTGNQQTITNFHASGAEHDVLVMPASDFSNLADVLRNTTMDHGNAVITDPNGHSTTTLLGVTKAELRAHPHDFSFHGTGQQFPGGN